jgi:phosphonate transport system substrate-binding protein
MTCSSSTSGAAVAPRRSPSGSPRAGVALRLVRTWRRVLPAVVVAAAAIAAPSSPSSAAVKPYRLGVVSFYNPRLMYLKYQPLVDYLSVRTGHPWELDISATYQRTVDALCNGELSLAYLGPFTYVRANAACGAVPIVRLQTAGKPTYRSYVLVRVDSGIDSLQQLRGRSFGFGSPLSTSSHLVPRAMLEKAGLAVGTDVSCRYYYHHERAARAVLMREVAACGVRDIVATRFVGRGLRILARSEPLPNFPLVVSSATPESLRRLLLEALVDIPQRDPLARRQMAGWDEELAGGFAPASDSEFDPIRSLAKRIFGPQALSLPSQRLICDGRG